MLFASLQMPETRFNEITDKVGCVSVPSFMARYMDNGVTCPSPHSFANVDLQQCSVPGER